eukprot:jgi/Chlat1/76/Chrsp1S03029
MAGAAEAAGGEAAANTKTVISWACKGCERECLPVREESRCLCGHRLKAHNPSQHPKAYACADAKCKCPMFFYIVAEGSWILRCRCKHKHVEHDPVTHACAKATCKCQRFDSPWVRPRYAIATIHGQTMSKKWKREATAVRHYVHAIRVVRLADMMEFAEAAAEVNAWHKVERGKA